METLQTAYAGLTLRNPLIVASSGLTNNIDKIKDIEKAGAGAVVLKSLLRSRYLIKHIMFCIIRRIIPKRMIMCKIMCGRIG